MLKTNNEYKWIDKTANEELWRITQQKPIEMQIKRRKWNWIGHTLRKEIRAIEKTALDGNPLGYRRRGGLRRTWRRTTEDEIRGIGKTWNEVKGMAGDQMPGNSSWMSCAPQGVKGLDDDDDDVGWIVAEGIIIVAVCW